MTALRSGFGWNLHFLEFAKQLNTKSFGPEIAITDETPPEVSSPTRMTTVPVTLWDLSLSRSEC